MIFIKFCILINYIKIFQNNFFIKISTYQKLGQNNFPSTPYCNNPFPSIFHSKIHSHYGDQKKFCPFFPHPNASIKIWRQPKWRRNRLMSLGKKRPLLAALGGQCRVRAWENVVGECWGRFSGEEQRSPSASWRSKCFWLH